MCAPLLSPGMSHCLFAALPSRVRVAKTPEAHFVPYASQQKATADGPSLHHISILDFF